MITKEKKSYHHEISYGIRIQINGPFKRKFINHLTVKANQITFSSLRWNFKEKC